MTTVGASWAFATLATLKNAVVISVLYIRAKVKVAKILYFLKNRQIVVANMSFSQRPRNYGNRRETEIAVHIRFA